VSERHIPLAAADLERYLRRARRLRIALAAAAVVLAAAALAFAFRLDDRPGRLVPAGSSGIIVLDVSSSITSDVYRQIERELAKAIATHDRYGLVVFSDIAYEALPPGTRAAELDPYRRYFTPLKQQAQPGYPPVSVGNLPFPTSPWTLGLSGGTRISTGLTLALDVLRRDGIRNGSVVLLSDLGDDASDFAALGNALVAYERFRLPLRVVALSPSISDRETFQGLLQRGHGTLEDAPPPSAHVGPSSTEARSPVPRLLLFAALGLLGALALSELWLGRLRWGIA
jgi:hypothetical protein